MSKKLRPEIIVKLFQTYVLPILEYSNLSFCPTKSQYDRLESVQKKVSKYICYKLGYDSLNYSQRLKILDIYSLEKRRKIQYLKMFYKLIYNFQGICKNWMTFLECRKTTRHGLIVKTSFNRLKLTDKLFFKYTSSLFNSLPFEIRNINSFSLFVNKLCDFF